MSDYIDTVDIEGAQYDIQDTATKQTADQNAQDIEAMKESADYSTEEHLTGRKWSDGRPTYEKTINFGALPNATSKSVQTGIQNLRTFVKVSGISYPGDRSVFRPLPYPHVNQNAVIGINLTATTLSVFTSMDYSSHTNTYVTLEYTKTTDSPQP